MNSSFKIDIHDDKNMIPLHQNMCLLLEEEITRQDKKLIVLNECELE